MPSSRMIALSISVEIGDFPSAQTNFPAFWQISGKRVAAVLVNDALREIAIYSSASRRNFIGWIRSQAAYPVLAQTIRQRPHNKEVLEIMAHPTRFERVTFAFGGYRSHVFFCDSVLTRY